MTVMEFCDRLQSAIADMDGIDSGTVAWNPEDNTLSVMDNNGNIYQVEVTQL